jgi:hypothetical protein
LSILHYQPSPDFKDTGRNVRYYVENHMDAFWDIFKPLMPYIAICIFLDLVITQHFMGINPDTDKPYDFVLFSIISNYFLACLIISWHRVIIHGPDSYTAMNPLKPTKGELGFIGMAIGLTIAAFVAGGLVGAISALISPALFGIAALHLMIFLIFMGCRLSFYFPAKATGNDITLKQAFKLSEGYVLRLIFAPLFAMWKVLLMTLAYFFVGFLIVIISGTAFGAYIQSGAGAVVVQFLFAAPIHLFFSPLLTIIGVTVLSNFYQYALQNPPTNKDDEHYI